MPPVTDAITEDRAERLAARRLHEAAVVATRRAGAARDRYARIHSAVRLGRATGAGLPSPAQAAADLDAAEQRLEQARQDEAAALQAMTARFAQPGP
jgi:hypothetical protein